MAEAQETSSVLGQEPVEAARANAKPDIAAGDWADLLANWPVVLAVAALCLMSRYWLSSHFGVYEDDYWRVPPALSTPVMKAPAAFLAQLQTFKQGRPLHGGFIGLFTSIGGSIDGLKGAYWIGYCISVLNALLLFTLLRRAEAGQALSTAAAAAFAVYPGDVSQAFLTHALGIQPALALVLVAMHLWLRGQRLASWALVFVAVFCYETPVPIFVAVPLLLPRWNGRQILRHAFVMVVGIAAVGVLREHLGEERVAQTNLLSAAGAAARNMSLGPVLSLTSYAWRPFEMAGGLDTIAVVLGLLAALIGLVLFLWYDSEDWGRLPRLAGAGLACLFSAYLLPVTLDVEQLDGRSSRIHYAASVGCAILVACMFGYVTKRAGRLAAATAMAVILGTSTAAGVAVQRDYQRSWDLQRTFWQQVVRLCPDLNSGKVVLVDGFHALPEARHLKVFEWHTILVLSELFQFPAPAPRLFLATPDWRHYQQADGALVLDESAVVWPVAGAAPLRVAGSDLIVLEARDGKLVRQDQPGPPVTLPEGIFYKYLLGP